MKRMACAMILLFCIVPDGFSQSVLNLTLEQSIAIARENNQQIQLAKDGVAYAKQQIREAKSTLFPQIDGNARYTRNIKSPVFFSNIAPEPIRIGEPNAFSLGVTLSQPIWLGGKLWPANQIAKLVLENARENLKLTEENIQLEVTKSFYSVVLMRETLEVAEETLASARSNFENIVLLKQQGVASEFDSLRAKVRLSNLNPEVIQARSSVQTVTNAFKFLLDLDQEREINLVYEWQFDAAVFPENEKDVALAKRKELIALKIQRDILNKAKRIARGDYYPSIMATAGIQAQAQSADFNIQSKEKATTIDAGLTISVPLFNGFRTAARVQEAQIEIDRVDRQIKMLTDQILMEVENNHLRVQEAQERLLAQSESVREAEKTLGIAKVRFSSGLSTQLELNDTETALERAKLSRLRAIYDFLIAKADYEKSIGIIQ